MMSLWGDNTEENSKENSKGPEAGMNHSVRPLWLDHWGRGKWYEMSSKTAGALNAKVVCLGFIPSGKKN